MKVRLVDINQRHLAAVHLLEERCEAFDMLDTFARLGLAQQLFDPLPAQAGGMKDAADGVAADHVAEGCRDPLAELLEGPAMAAQAVVEWLGEVDGVDEGLGFLGRKRGASPPVRR